MRREAMEEGTDRAETAGVDVVIVTRDRPGSLAALLQDLQESDPRPARVVVVDDSERPEPWAERYPDLALEVVHPTTRAFISRAKNLGAARSRAEFIAFIDDDNRIPPDLLGRLADDLRTHPTWGAVMPGVLYHRRPELVWVYATPFREGRWAFELRGRNAVRDPALERRFLPTDALPNLSMMRAALLRRVGGFDERLPVNSSGDLCQRLKGARAEVWADTGVLTRHDVDPPGVPGYWAEHTVQNPVRCRLEVADWFRFQRRWNGSRSFFGLRASWHATGFVLPKLLAAVVRTDGRPLSLSVAILRGYRDGLRPEFASSPEDRGGA
jgi:glycosyltransferase involved in cell wall biosynthesis